VSFGSVRDSGRSGIRTGARDQAHQALLHHGDDEGAVAAEEKAAGQASGAEGVGAVHVVEKPFVDPEGPVEPHAVVEAGPHELGVVPGDLVGSEHGVEEGHVGGVGRDAGVQEGVVAEGAVGLDPQTLDWFEVVVLHPGQFTDVALIDGVGRANQSAN